MTAAVGDRLVPRGAGQNFSAAVEACELAYQHRAVAQQKLERLMPQPGDRVVDALKIIKPQLRHHDAEEFAVRSLSLGYLNQALISSENARCGYLLVTHPSELGAHRR